MNFRRLVCQYDVVNVNLCVALKTPNKGKDNNNVSSNVRLMHTYRVYLVCVCLVFVCFYCVENRSRQGKTVILCVREETAKEKEENNQNLDKYIIVIFDIWF